MESDYSSAIIQCNGKTVAVYKENDAVYWFDSHSCGESGGSAANGKACIIKYTNLDVVPAELSKLLHRNCQPKSNELDAYRFAFSITPMIFTRILNQPEIESESSSSDSDEGSSNLLQSPNNSPIKKKRKRVVADICEDENEESTEQNEVQETSPMEFLRNIGKQMDMDCQITEDDFVKPDFSDYDPSKVTLNRRQRKPISDVVEKNLELLSFPHPFLYGRNGLNEPNRLIPITTLDYYQQRLMSAYQQFASNTEYLF